MKSATRVEQGYEAFLHKNRDDLISDFSSKENKLLIHLDKIDQISGVLGKIEILDITFDEVNANAVFKV